MRHTKSLLVILCSLAFLAACSGGDEGSGVSRNKSVADVTPEEEVALCEEVNTYIDPEAAMEFECYYGAILQSAENPEADCQMIADACLAEAEPEPADDCMLEENPEEPPACADQVTVGEMLDCLEDLTEAFQADIDCATPVEDLPDLQNLPASCQAVQAKCPELFSEG